ncbi:hypothetical protein [Effusibacillus dendaii]|uniref:Uncharacterized protein n=1 Tax=Effusibacillus dendaii TaxID=2743772 RepID=A0A7I8DFS8_9BACL|nr:hypothetical protein [Effusibacillus dendaii]BCJ88172.1 hypothetical protein skT53_31570 [Effusibacillus dendaii]
MSILNKFLKSRRAAATTLISLTIVLLLTYAAFLIVEVGRLYALHNRFQNDLDFANGAAWAAIDRERLAYGVVQFHAVNESRSEGDRRAEDVFLAALRKGMNVSDLMTPESPAQSVIAGPVELNDFQVYLASDLPAATPQGFPIEKISVYSKITIPVKLLFFGQVFQMGVQRVTDFQKTN